MSNGAGGRMLSRGKKLGYSIGIFSDTLGYSLFYSYFSVFLTTVVGVNAAVAGIISAIGILWDGITDPIVGYIADGKPHRRRKMIMWTSIPYALSVILTFVAVDFGNVGNTIYYTICVLCFWLFYTTVCVPFYSAVPELTPNYDERTEVRSFTATINTGANLITLACPMILVNFFGTWTKSASGGWTLTAVLFGIIIVIAAFICANTMKKAEEEQIAAGKVFTVPEREKRSFGKATLDLLKTFFGVLKLKTVLILFASIVICNVFRGFTSTGFTYYMIYGMGWGSAEISIAYAILIASWLFYFPLVNVVCRKWDRKVCLIAGALLTLVGRLVVGFTELAFTPFGCYLSIFFSNFLTCTYLALIFAMPYDLAELYEYKHNGERADSTIQSVPFMGQKIGAAIGALVWGIALDATGFVGTAAAQSAETIREMVSMYCGGWISIAILGYVGFLLIYKVNKKKVSLIQDANKARNEGKPYSAEGFEDLLA